MTECPHPEEHIKRFDDYNSSIDAYEVGAECGICGHVLWCEAQDADEREEVPA